MKEAPIIALMGVTATGKTALAIELAAELGCEVISVDSAMVYRGLDIGSAKPTEAECSGIQHHLIDILEPYETYSAAQFVQDALAQIQINRSQGKPSLLVGGTMLYFSALFHGLSDLPPTPIELKDQLECLALQQGSQYLHDRLAQVDQVSAARLHPNDAQRIIRALAVWEITGRPLSEQQGNKRPSFTEYSALALLPEDRERHKELLKDRFLHMLDNGFEEEVEALFSNPELTPLHPSMTSVGYRQWWSYLAGDLSKQAAIERSINATCQLAKHQRTWLNRFPDGKVISSEKATHAVLLDHLMPFLGQLG